MDDPDAFGAWFAGESWDAWRCILRAAYCLPMTANDREMFAELAGGRDPPRRRVKQLFVVGGRRGGKDSVARLLAVFAATLEEGHLGRLRPGERALVQLLAVDREQSKIVLGYIRSYFERIPDLRRMVTRETRNGFELSNDVSISITTNSFRQVRGTTILLSIFDECAYWKDETSVKPDFETFRAVMPGLATIPDSMLVAISSPYRKSGLLYEKWKAHYGKESDDVLVIQATSQQLNPLLDAAMIAQEIEADPAAGAAEWLGQFRTDIASFIDISMIESCVDPGVAVRPPRQGTRYTAFVDVASGSGQDSFTVAVAHKDKDDIVLDLCHAIAPPFNPQSAVAEVAALLKGYGVKACVGDKYGAGLTVEMFAKEGLRYSYAERDRSQIYCECLPLLTSGRARLVENRKMMLQFASLERRVSSGGRDRIEHPDRMHDDLANAAAGALVEVSSKPGAMVISDSVLAEAARLRSPFGIAGGRQSGWSRQNLGRYG